MNEPLALSTFVKPLHKVEAEFQEKPSRSFDISAALGPIVLRYIEQRGHTGDILEYIHNLPLRALTKLSFDQLCKVKQSTFLMMDQSVDDLYRKDPEYMIFNKITNSMWRWGASRGKWNEVVDCYDGLRSFDFGLKDFDVRLDFTTGHNECGYSEYSRTFLDGVFALIVYYRGEPVMTIGFSFAGDDRILLQQVQLTSRKGNRWLFKLPKPRLEYVLDLFNQQFPQHEIYLADGAELAKKSLRSYRNGIESAKKMLSRATEERSRATYQEELEKFQTKAAHLEQEIARLADFYAKVGDAYMVDRTGVLERNGLIHHRVARCAEMDGLAHAA